MVGRITYWLGDCAWLQPNKTMGYTHYIHPTRTLTDPEWVAFTIHVQRIFAASPCVLADGSGDVGTLPRVGAEGVRFNGLDEESYETCAIDRNHVGFECCKVSDRPYDPVVGAVYLAFQAVHGGSIVSSDGDMEGADWAAARSLFESTQAATPSPRCEKCQAYEHEADECPHDDDPGDDAPEPYDTCPGCGAGSPEFRFSREDVTFYDLQGSHQGDYTDGPVLLACQGCEWSHKQEPHGADEERIAATFIQAGL